MNKVYTAGGRGTSCIFRLENICLKLLFIHLCWGYVCSMKQMTPTDTFIASEMPAVDGLETPGLLQYNEG